MSDDNPPSAYWETSPRAKKPRKCYECKRVIPVGVRYRGVAGIWDHEFDHFTICMRCARLHAYMRSIDMAAYFGQLMEMVSEAGLRPWLTRVRKAGPQWDDTATVTTVAGDNAVEEAGAP